MSFIYYNHRGGRTPPKKTIKNIYYFESWDLYVNGTKIKKVYSKQKAINLANKWCGELFEQRKVEVVDALTGEVVYQIN